MADSIHTLCIGGLLVCAGCGTTTTEAAVDDAAIEVSIDAFVAPDAIAVVDAALPEVGVDAVDAAPRPPPGNALRLSDGRVVPLYPVRDPSSTVRAIGFVAEGSKLRAIDEDRKTLWEKPIDPSGMSGGFDFDGDGWPDLAFTRTEKTSKPCGATVYSNTRVELAQGKTGATFAPTTPLESICWTFGTTIYPTEQWTDLGVLFGAGTTTLAMAPYYAQTGAFVDFDPKAGGFVTTSTYHYPSTTSFDATYVVDKPNAHDGTHSYEQYSHVGNGMLLTHEGQKRMVLFTGARVAQYAVAPLGPMQLVADTPYLTNGRKDLVGRNYGLVVRDPARPRSIHLLAGTGVDSVFFDQKSAKMENDPWAGIERHVTAYDLGTGAVDDRFFSYAHDGGDAFKYEGRLAYPDGPLVATSDGASRLAFNLYKGGHWELHVTKPGSTADERVLRDWLLWDIADVDGDGTPDWVLSPVRDATDPDVPGWYFPKWRIVLGRWNEPDRAMVPGKTFEGMIPYLQATFRAPEKTTSRSYRYPVLVERTAAGLEMLVWKSGGSLGSVLLTKSGG